MPKLGPEEEARPTRNRMLEWEEETQLTGYREVNPPTGAVDPWDDGWGRASENWLEESHGGCNARSLGKGGFRKWAEG